jgi:hypothetical protein
MKKLLYVVLFTFCFACGKNEPQINPDLANSVTGKYIFTHTENLFGVISEYTVEWTIVQTGEHQVSLQHKISEQVIGANPNGYEPAAPFSAMIKDINVTETGKFTINQTVDFTFAGLQEPAKILAHGIVSGQNLIVDFTQTTLTDNEVDSEKLTFKKQ